MKKREELLRKWWRFEKKLPAWIRWYILGNYHCDSCPMCWEDWSCGDCDCGCYIFGDIREGGCRLLPPIRAIIGWPRKKRHQYAEYHAYDGMEAWFVQQQLQKDSFAKCIETILDGIRIQSKRLDGTWADVPIEEITSDFYGFSSHMYDAVKNYEDTIYPTPYVPLKTHWHQVLSKTKARLFQSSAPQTSTSAEQIAARKKAVFAESCEIALRNYNVFFKTDSSATMIPVTNTELLSTQSPDSKVLAALRFYENEVHPPIQDISLREEWSQVLSRTWEMTLAPYFTKY